MLSYAFQTLRETGLVNLASEDFDNIHDLFAAILVRGTGTQVKRGLHRDYIQTEEDNRRGAWPNIGRSNHQAADPTARKTGVCA